MINDIMDISPKLWGFSGWIYLTSVALVYTPDKKDKYLSFFSNLILPCSSCGYFYEYNLKKLNDALKNKNTLLEWLLNIRNEINIKQNKKILTLDESINQIFSNRKPNTWTYYIILLLLIIIIYLFNK